MSVYAADLSGNNPAGGIVLGDPKTKPRGFNAYDLAGTRDAKGNITGIASLAGTTGTPPIYDVTGGSYIFFASFGGTSPSLQLQYLGSDGTWYNIDSARTASGAGSTGVVIGEGATLRLYNTTANAITNLTASLT